MKAKLSPCGLGFALGAAKGLYLMLSAWVAYFFGYGAAMVGHVAGFYNGYGASVAGGFVGAGYGFVCGFIFGLFVAYFYNFALRCCCKDGECKSECK